MKHVWPFVSSAHASTATATASYGKAAPVLQRDESVLRACTAATQAAMNDPYDPGPVEPHDHGSDEGD